jgi:hypothetical protein
MEGEDFARECDLAVRVPLTWACPHCGGRQEWEFSQKRAEEFKCRMQNAECRMQNEKPKPGTYAGMIIPHSTRMADGAEIEVSADERALGAEWECYWCGARLADTPPLRRQLMDSYQQIIPSPAPRAVVFDWPEEASLGISFAESVRHFLTADAAQKAGNIIPKQDWYMQRRARTWNPALTRPQIDIAPGSYDPNQIVPDEHSRNMAVDCQQDQVVMDKTGKSVTGWFWYIVRVVDKFGNSKQLARGYVKSWEEWIAVQKKWKVPNDRVVIDIGQWPGQITQRAADERETVAVNKMTMLGFMKDRTVTWYLLAAELMRRQFKHRDGQIRPWSPPQPIPATVFDNDGRRQVIHLKKIRWDNMTFRLQVDALRSGAPGMPKMEVLGREFLDAQTQAMERGDLTYERQMDAQYYIPEKRQFKELRPNDHYMACEAMLLVRQAMDGMMGHLAIAEDSSQESVVRS